MLAEGKWGGKRGESEGGWKKEEGGGNDGGFLARFGDGDNIAVSFLTKDQKNGARPARGLGKPQQLG